MSRSSENSYRTIQPISSVSGSSDNSRRGPERGDLQPRRRNIIHACDGCRQAKIRCDGERPKCGPCVTKNGRCVYEERRSRLVATKSRLESAEKLLATLRTSSQDQADRILHRIRTAKNPSEIIAESAENPAGLFEEEGQHLSTATNEHSPELPRLSLPEASITKAAINAFFSCSGKLFHVFPKEQVEQHYRAVFQANHRPWSEEDKVRICFLMSIASVGAQYLHGKFNEDTEHRFYSLARYFLEAVMTNQPLDSVKVCTLLAMYNIMDKATVSLAYVETGLGVCRRYGLSTGFQPPYLSESQWIDYRKTWRTLAFISSWLSSTLGYISGNDVLSDRVPLSEIKVEDIEDLSEIVQVEMTKICLLKAEILRMHLAFKELTVPAIQAILHDLHKWYRELPALMRLTCAGHEDISVETRRSIFHVHLLYLGAIILLYRRIGSQFAQSYTADRNGSVLPIPLEGLVAEISGEAVTAAKTSARIIKLLLEDNAIFKRCWLIIFQTYTSCVIMLHSAAQKQLHGFAPSTWEADMQGAKNCLEVLEFCGDSDRVANQFLRKLAIYFDEIAKCSEKRLRTDGSDPTDVEQASSPGRSFADPGDDHDDLLDQFNYLLRLPKNSHSSHVDFCLSLLGLLARPFGDPSVMGFVEYNIKEGWRNDPTRYEHPQLIERLEWDFENSVPFQWNINLPRPDFSEVTETAELSREPDGEPPQSRFIGSTSPSGWKDRPYWRNN